MSRGRSSSDAKGAPNSSSTARHNGHALRHSPQEHMSGCAGLYSVRDCRAYARSCTASPIETTSGCAPSNWLTSVEPERTGEAMQIARADVVVVLALPVVATHVERCRARRASAQPRTLENRWAWPPTCHCPPL